MSTLSLSRTQSRRKGPLAIKPGRRLVVEGGFSLMELLVVIAIIGLLAAVASSGLGGSDGAKLKTALSVLISQTQAARTTAIAKNAPARLLIDSGNDRENGRRLIAVAVKNTDGSWEIAGTPALLPDGATFLVGDGQSPSSTAGGTSAPPPTMALDFRNQHRTWYYLEFDPEGTCEENAGAILVLGLGRHTGTEWVRKNPDLLQAAMIRRSGQVSAFSDPAHIRDAFGAL